MLGFFANVTFFLVGWHYVKQGYGSLYVWLVRRLDPMLMVLVPTFHSLQYITVVSRYGMNVERGRRGGTAPPRTAIVARYFPTAAHPRFVGFLAVGVLLGYVGFIAAPGLLGNDVAYDQATFGAGMFLFMFCNFINVHHYFLDNIMWRRENPDTGKYLFAHSDRH